MTENLSGEGMELLSGSGSGSGSGSVGIHSYSGISMLTGTSLQVPDCSHVWPVSGSVEWKATANSVRDNDTCMIDNNSIQILEMKVIVNAAGQNPDSVNSGTVNVAAGFKIDEKVENFMGSMGSYNINLGSQSVSYWTITYKDGNVISSTQPEIHSFSVSVIFRLWGYEEKFGLHGEGTIDIM